MFIFFRVFWLLMQQRMSVLLRWLMKSTIQISTSLTAKERSLDWPWQMFFTATKLIRESRMCSLCSPTISRHQFYYEFYYKYDNWDNTFLPFIFFHFIIKVCICLYFSCNCFRYFRHDFVELHRVLGVSGVYIATNLTKDIPNKRKLQTWITFNKGGEWSRIRGPPELCIGNVCTLFLFFDITYSYPCHLHL